jgi:D-alanyl-D-alanine carboxypeptidase
MKREGIKPEVTSAWRSAADQARLHKCSRSARCRKAHPGLYYALPSGQSLHEAGFAVDISGVAAGPRGNKRLTTRGRRIVSIMRKNGFDWRYGLADPAHFEADPRESGYRSVKAAINKNQKQCSVNLIAGKQKKSNGKASARATAKPTPNGRASIQALPTRRGWRGE